MAAGQRLKRAIHIARSRAGITSDTALAVKAGVHYDTLMNWYSDRTVPRPAELRKVADVLAVRLSDLMDAYEGRDPEPIPLHEAIRELVAELRAQHEIDRVERAAIREATAELLRVIAAHYATPTLDRVGNGNGGHR